MVALGFGAVLLIAVLLGAMKYYKSTGTVKLDSMAVLPFVNRSGNPEEEYLCDGITEGLIHKLSQLPDMRVLSRSTVFRYKGLSDDPVNLGKNLNVGAVLVGSLVRHGGSVHLESELVDTQNGAEIWGTQYDRKLSDVAGLQEEIVQDVSEKLKLRLSPAQKQTLVRSKPENWEAGISAEPSKNSAGPLSLIRTLIMHMECTRCSWTQWVAPKKRRQNISGPLRLIHSASSTKQMWQMATMSRANLKKRSSGTERPWNWIPTSV